jgi:hypothetical protein
MPAAVTLNANWRFWKQKSSKRRPLQYLQFRQTVLQPLPDHAHQVRHGEAGPCQLAISQQVAAAPISSSDAIQCRDRNTGMEPDAQDAGALEQTPDQR